MNCINKQKFIKLVSFFGLWFSLPVSALNLNFKDTFYSGYGSYGDKLAAYTFLESKVRIPTVNLTGQATLGDHSLSINLESTVKPSAYEQVGVLGRVERFDWSVNMSTRLYENFTPEYISIPHVINYFYGYAEGVTKVNFDDGVWLNYQENGVFGGISGAFFFNKWLASLSVSLSRGLWFDTIYTQRSSDGGVKSLDGVSSGWSLSVNYAVPIKQISFDNDVFIGFKSNNYAVDIDNDSEGLPYIKERLIFYYLGISAYY